MSITARNAAPKPVAEFVRPLSTDEFLSELRERGFFLLTSGRALNEGCFLSCLSHRPSR